MKAKYQDNLEMLQWIKRYYDINSPQGEYDAVARRKGADLYLLGGDNGIMNKAKAYQPAVEHPVAKKQPLTSISNQANKSAQPVAKTSIAIGGSSAKDAQRIGELEEQIKQL
jgi:hypothetical protein